MYQDALTKAAELRMVQAEVNLNNDKTTLTQSLLMDPFEQYDVEKPAWDLNKLGYDGLTMEDLAEKAKAQRGDYQRAVSSELSAKFGMRASRGFNMMPSVYLFGSPDHIVFDLVLQTFLGPLRILIQRFLLRHSSAVLQPIEQRNVYLDTIRFVDVVGLELI
jgi:hypothetical protein